MFLINLKTKEKEPFTPEKGLKIIKNAYKNGGYKITKEAFEIQKDNISDYVKNDLKKWNWLFGDKNFWNSSIK